MFPLLAAGVIGVGALLGSAGTVIVRRRRRRARQLYRQALEQALADGVLTPEEEGELEALREAKDLSEWEVRMAALALYRRALKDVAADARVTPEEDAHLHSLQSQLGLSEQDLARDRSKVQRLRVLARIERGELPMVVAPVALSPGEVCHWVVRGTLCRRIALPTQEREPEGIAFDIQGSAPFQVEGRRDPLEESAQVLPQDLGMVAVTSRRVLFRGARREVSFAHVHLHAFALYADGIVLNTHESTDRRYLLTEDPELTAAILLAAARRRRQEVAGPTAPARVG